MIKKTRQKNILEFNIGLGRVNLTQKAIFAKHLSVMLKAGLTINEALAIAAESARGKLKNVLAEILKSVQAGNTLASSFIRYHKIFPSSFISSIRAGELSGTLAENLDRLATQLEKEKELTGKVKGAMFYPIVVMAAAFVLGLAMAFIVLPKIIPLFEGLKMDLPASTRALIWSSHFIQNHSVSLLVGLVVFVIFMIWLVRQRFVRPVTHWLLLKTPIVRKISHNTNIVRFCRTLGTLLKSGLNINEALEICVDTVNNHYFQGSLRQISQSIDRGAKLSNNLKYYSKLFPVMVVNMIRVGEESGNLEETLFYLADFYESEVDTATKTLATAIEPALLIAIGLLVGFLALSIITPIYNITSGIKR